MDLLNLKHGQKVLDVGCGIGGGDFYMAKVRLTRPGEISAQSIIKMITRTKRKVNVMLFCRCLGWKCLAWICPTTWLTLPLKGQEQRSCHQYGYFYFSY